MPGAVGHREVSTPVTARCVCGETWEVPYRRARAIDVGDRQTSCPGCRRLSFITFLWGDRRCGRRDCAQPLGRYNPGPDCHACDRRPVAA